MGKVAKATAASAGERKKPKGAKSAAKPGRNAGKKESKLRGTRVPLMKSLKRPAGAKKTFQSVKKSPSKNRHAKRRKVEDGAKNQEKLEKVKPDLNSKQVAQAIKAVLALAKQEAEKKKELFEGEQLPILLQVSSIKIPKVPTRQLRIVLPHTLVTDTDDVALFVRDMQKGRGRDFEPTKEHYWDILRQHGCTCIKEVIPLNQVKTEFGQYETKRKLLATYDRFLTDGRIAGHLTHLLGKIFAKKRKLPTSIRMESRDLKHEIEYALRKTTMPLHSHGTTHTLQVGHASMSEQSIAENLSSLCDSLATHYPGGWANVRSLILKTQTSLPVPVYVSLKNKSEVKVPVIIAKRPKAHRAYEGELSTLSGDATVKVMPDGTVTMKRKRVSNNNKILRASEKPLKKAKLKNKKTSEGKLPSEPKDADDSELDFEDKIADVEESYLSQWQHQNANSLEEERKETKKALKEKKKLVPKKSKTVLSSKPSQEQLGIGKKKKQEKAPRAALLSAKKQKIKKPDERNGEPKKTDKSNKKSKVVEDKASKKLKTASSANVPDAKSKIKLNRKEELVKDYVKAEMLAPESKVKKQKKVPSVVSEKPKKSKMKMKTVKRLQK